MFQPRQDPVQPMASIYLRGETWWCKLKNERGEWVAKSTGCKRAQEADARRVAAAAQKALDRKRAAASGESPAELTVARYAERWVKVRDARGIAATEDEERRLRLHVLPAIGAMRLADVRPMHVRDVVRALRQTDAAPRTVLHVYGAMRGLFADAVGDERIAETPCRLARGELPRKVDADPEWRAQATYTTAEVEQLVSDPHIPPERRVQYALKAIAGARHSEVAALRWRSYDPTAEPLGALLIARAYDSRRDEIRGTKTGAVIRVPVHRTLAAILAAWKLSHWERIHGRTPTADDLIVPARTGAPVDVADAGHALHADLEALGLRITAGATRKRGGHDLRSWFQTQTIEDGADSTLIRRVTHQPPSDVAGGYERFSWSALCREVSKLQIRLDGEPLALGTGSGTAEQRAENRWRNRVTPKGLEAK